MFIFGWNCGMIRQLLASSTTRKGLRTAATPGGQVRDTGDWPCRSARRALKKRWSEDSYWNHKPTSVLHILRGLTSPIFTKLECIYCCQYQSIRRHWIQYLAVFTSCLRTKEFVTGRKGKLQWHPKPLNYIVEYCRWFMPIQNTDIIWHILSKIHSVCFKSKNTSTIPLSLLVLTIFALAKHRQQCPSKMRRSGLRWSFPTW